MEMAEKTGYQWYSVRDIERGVRKQWNPSDFELINTMAEVLGLELNIRLATA